MINNFNIDLPNSVKYILEELNKNGYEGYIVGGCVRDSFLGKEPHDWDICTNAKPNEIISCFPHKEIIPTGLKHGTVTISFDKIPYEITTYRIDGEYSDGRHPDEVKFTNSLYEDLSRRDFTINAMAYSPIDGLKDPFNGKKDLNKKIIKCVGNAEERFSEDALRILRCWRFAIQLGFDIDKETLNAAKKMIDRVSLISKERIQSEFLKAIKGNVSLFAYQQNFFLEAIFPEWKDMELEQKNPYHIYNVALHSLTVYSLLNNDTDEITKIAALLHDIGKPYCYQDSDDGIRHFKGHGSISAEIVDKKMKELKFDNYTRENVVELIKYHDATIEPTEKIIKRWLNKIGEEQFGRLIQLRRADIGGQNPTYAYERLSKITNIEEIYKDIIKRKSCYNLKDLKINGHDIMELFNIKPGKEIGIILNDILDKVINNELDNEKDIIISYLQGKDNNIDYEQHDL